MAQFQEMRLRYNLALTEKTTAFVPKALSDHDVALVEQKHAQLGALFVDRLGKLPRSKCGILWDVEYSPAPTSTIRPIKPKLWLVGKATLQPGVTYILE
jgi:hypothetical protein